MFQIRSRDGSAYRPGRDIAYIYQDIVREAMIRLARDSWHEAIRPYAAHCGVTEQDLVKAAVIMAQFITLTTNSNRNFADAWVDSGMSSLPGPVLMMIMFQIGAGTTATFHAAAREVTPYGGSAPGADKMTEIADRAAFALKGDAHERARRTNEMTNTFTSFDTPQD